MIYPGPRRIAAEQFGGVPGELLPTLRCRQHPGRGGPTHTRLELLKSRSWKRRAAA